MATSSELAEKYGQASNGWGGGGKSGLTPVPNPNDARDRRLPRDFIETRKRLRTYQETHLAKFTTKELQDIGSIDASDVLLLTDLKTPIHPIYKKDLWRDVPDALPIGHGIPGVWSVQVTQVWEALEPCLKLASLFLVNEHVWTW